MKVNKCNRAGRSIPQTAGPKADPIEVIRDLTADFVRAIDATRFACENVATSELAERLTALIGLHAMASEEAELSKEPTDKLRQRLSVIRQVVSASRDLDYSAQGMTNGQLKKRIEHLRLFSDAEADFAKLSDYKLQELRENAAAVLRDREYERRKEAKAAAKAVPVRLAYTGDDLIEDEIEEGVA